MRFVLAKFFLWAANRVPDFYVFRPLKALFLRFSGVNVRVVGLYFLAPINIDRPWKISIGKGVFINRNCTFEGEGTVTVGDNIHIGPNVVFATTNHVLGKMDEAPEDVKILENVWIGANATIVPGVTLGPNVVVGAGAVVTKNFKNAVIVGVPAKTIKKIANA